MGTQPDNDPTTLQKSTAGDAPNTHEKASKTCHKMSRKRSPNGLFFKLPARPPPRAPRRRPKTTPGAPKGAPRGAKGGPRDPQRPPDIFFGSFWDLFVFR